MNRKAAMVRPDASRHCPECHGDNIVVTSVRYGTMVFFCPNCEHGWSGSDSRRALVDPRRLTLPVAIERRVQPRRAPKRQ